jgi:hypothetical protein
MPIAKYTSAKGMVESADASSGFFVEDASIVENQQTIAYSVAKMTVLCQDNDNSNPDALTNNAAVSSFFFYDGDGARYYVWYDNESNEVTDPALTGTGIQVTLLDNGTDAAAAVATKTAAAINTALATKVEALASGTSVIILPLKAAALTAEVVLMNAQTMPTGASAAAFTMTAVAGEAETAILPYGSTEFSLSTAPGAAGYILDATLADGAYVGQYKYLVCSATPSNTADIRITLASGDTSKTKLLFDAIGESVMLIWTGTLWAIALNVGSVGVS